LSVETKLKVLQSVVSGIFQLERLQELASKNFMVNMAYSAWIMNVNYALFHQPGDDPNTAIVIGNIRYPFTLDGRLAAIAEASRHMAGKLDDALSVQNLNTVFSSLDFAVDIAKAVVAGK